MKIKTTIALFLLVCSFSCMSNRKALSQWVGANQNELIEKWGDPDRIEMDGPVSIWIYERFNKKFPGTTGTKSTSTRADGSSEYDDASAVKFYISPNRTIYKYELVE